MTPDVRIDHKIWGFMSHMKTPSTLFPPFYPQVEKYKSRRRRQNGFRCQKMAILGLEVKSECLQIKFSTVLPPFKN